jgi:hypothetical protein
MLHWCGVMGNRCGPCISLFRRNRDLLRIGRGTPGLPLHNLEYDGVGVTGLYRMLLEIFGRVPHSDFGEAAHEYLRRHTIAPFWRTTVRADPGCPILGPSTDTWPFSVSQVVKARNPPQRLAEIILEQVDLQEADPASKYSVEVGLSAAYIAPVDRRLESVGVPPEDGRFGIICGTTAPSISVVATLVRHAVVPLASQEQQAAS